MAHSTHKVGYISSAEMLHFLIFCKGLIPLGELVGNYSCQPGLATRVSN